MTFTLKTSHYGFSNYLYCFYTDVCNYMVYLFTLMLMVFKARFQTADIHCLNTVIIKLPNSNENVILVLHSEGLISFKTNSCFIVQVPPFQI